MKSWKDLSYNQKILTTSFVITFCLVLITGWYAVSTYTMVNIMKKDFEISNRPYITVRTSDKRLDNNNLIYSVALVNSGKTPGIIINTKIEGLNDNSSKLLSNTDSSTILNPGEFIGHDLATIMADSLNSEYKIKLTILYKSPSQQEVKYKTIYLYRYSGNSESKLTIIESDLE